MLARDSMPGRRFNLDLIDSVAATDEWMLRAERNRYFTSLKRKEMYNERLGSIDCTLRISSE